MQAFIQSPERNPDTYISTVTMLLAQHSTLSDHGVSSGYLSKMFSIMHGILLKDKESHGKSNLFLDCLKVVHGLSSSNLASSVMAKVQPSIFETLIPARAVENTVYFIYVNLVGTQENLVFWGGSEIRDPLANQILKAPYFKESVKVCDIDLKQIEFARANRPVLRDIKSEIYNDLYKLSRTHKLDTKK